MSKARVKITGLNEIQSKLRQVAKRMNRNLVPAITEATLTIQKESQDRAPIDTGNLRAGHRTRVFKFASGKVMGVIRLLASYALFVHEASPDVHFKSEWPRGRKFLERGITDNLDKIKKNIMDWVKR